MERVCVWCMEEIIERGDKESCKKCYDINKDYVLLKRKKWEQKRKDNALCLSCGKPLDCEGVNCNKCKKKAVERLREWRNNNKEHYNEYQRAYREKNREKIKKYYRERYLKSKGL